ncbi:MAG: DUF305 domain-containing protein [Hyphomicrobium sp.]
MHAHSYARLAAMTVLSFISMYILMYAMVDGLANVYPNVNQFYMAGLMTAPMVIIELLLMGAMYENKSANWIILLFSALALVGFFALIRTQTAITDKQFLKSMIPHHAGAILMCTEAPIEDAGIKDFCRKIITGQQAEIDEMKAKLSRIQ